MDLVSRLKQYLNTRSVSITQFADECEIPRPSASQLLAGRNKKVSDEIISKIHYTYPDLSIPWLMFGEGDMLTDTNIKTSAAQNPTLDSSNPSHESNSQNYSEISSSLFSVNDSEPEKSTQPKNEEFTFSFGSDSPMEASGPATTTDSHQKNSEKQIHPITVTPGKDKCVTGIVVYYSDSTYESFVPDPEAKHPFLR